MGNDTDAPRPGFDKWVSFKGQGTYFATDGLTPQQIASGKRQTLNVDGHVTNRNGYITDELTDYALDWLQHGRDTSKPFFLYLSHKAIHADAVLPERYKNQYTGLDIPMPASMANTPENNRGKPKWVLDQRNSWHGVDYPYYTQDKFADRVRDIYRTLSPVDESLGRLLAYLRKAGIEKDTLIVFTSDNGFFYGDHGLIDKRNAYEPSIRVPMLVYAPGLLPRGVVNPTLVRNLDIAPTFLDVAHIPEPARMEGRGWLGVAEGKVIPADWKPGDFVYEYYWEWNFPQTPTTFAIERDRVKYIQYHGIWDTEELYDLNTDPDEMRNLIDDPAFAGRKAALRSALFDQLANDKGTHVVPFTRKTNPGTVDRNANGARPGDYPPSWYVQPKGVKQ